MHLRITLAPLPLLSSNFCAVHQGSRNHQQTAECKRGGAHTACFGQFVNTVGIGDGDLEAIGSGTGGRQINGEAGAAAAAADADTVCGYCQISGCSSALDAELIVCQRNRCSAACGVRQRQIIAAQAQISSGTDTF